LGTGEPHLFTLRCESWSCPGCGRLLCERWCGHAATRTEDLAEVYTATFPAGQEPAWKKRQQRAGGPRFRLELPDGRGQYLARDPFPGSEALGRDDALGRIRSVLEARIGRQGRPVRGTGEWRLPPGEKSECPRYRSVCQAPQHADEILAHHQATLVPT